MRFVCPRVPSVCGGLFSLSLCGLYPTGIVNSFCYLFAYERIAICGDDFVESHLRCNDVNIVPSSHELLDSRVLKPGIGKNRWNVRVNFSSDVEKNGGILAAREGYINLPFVVLIPLDDPGLRDLDFSL